MLSIPVYSQNSVPISSGCPLLSQSNTYYYLTSNVACTSGTSGIQFGLGTSNSTLNCMGHDITAVSGGSTAITVENAANIVVENCVSYYEFSASNAMNILIKNNNASSPLGIALSGDEFGGIYITDTSGAQVYNNTVNNNNEGIETYNVQNSIVRGNKGVFNLGACILDSQGNNNKILNNTCNANQDDGILLIVSSDDLVANNTATGNLDAGFEQVATNHTKVSYNNLNGNGNAGILDSYINAGSSLDGVYKNNELQDEGVYPINPSYSPVRYYSNTISYTTSGNAKGPISLNNTWQYLGTSPLLNATKIVLLDGTRYVINQTYATSGTNNNLVSVQLKINNMPVTIPIGATTTSNGISIEFISGYNNSMMYPAQFWNSTVLGVKVAAVASPVAVNIKPNKVVLKVGKSATIKSTVSGGVPPYSYSWSEETYPSTTYIPISGCTTTSTKCAITDFAIGTYKIELVVTDAQGNTGTAVPTKLQVLSKTAQVPAGTVNGTAANGNVTFVDVGNTTQSATPAQVPNNTSQTQQGTQTQSIWGAIVSFFQRLFGGI